MLQFDEIVSAIREIVPEGRLNEVFLEPRATPLKARAEALCSTLSRSFPIRRFERLDEDSVVASYLEFGVLLADSSGVLAGGRAYGLSHVLPIGYFFGDEPRAAAASFAVGDVVGDMERGITSSGYALHPIGLEMFSAPVPGYLTYRLAEGKAGLEERPACLGDILFYDSCRVLPRWHEKAAATGS